MRVKDVVLVHGWGLNKAVWFDYVDSLRSRLPSIQFHLIDIPGYGELVSHEGSADIEVLAKECLLQAPDQAVWVGWSLGGMIALQAALVDLSSNVSARVQALQLINAVPKFVQSEDWPSGVDIAVFDKFCSALAEDYERTLNMFLLLQAGATKNARQLAREAQLAIQQYDRPSEQTLRNGIRCLASVDFREDVKKLCLPAQVISGKLDRVTMPESCRALSQMMPAELIEVHAGHAPFLTDVEFMVNNFEGFVTRVEASDAG